MSTQNRFNNAVQLFQARKLVEAECECGSILAVEPECVPALQLMGVILSSRGDHAGATVALRKAVDLQPTSAEFRNNLGECQRRAGNFELAASSFREAIQLAPNLPEAHFNLANALKQLGELDGAIEHFLQAIRLRPRYAKAHMNLGNLHREQCRFRSASKCYDAALAIEPSAEAHLALAGALQDLDETARAIEHYQKAVALQPGHPAADMNLGQAYAAEGRIDDARRALARHAARDPLNGIKALRAACVCDPVMPDGTAIDAYQDQLDRALDAALHGESKLALDQLGSDGPYPPAELPYHGRDHSSLRRKFASLLERSIPGFPFARPESKNEKPRVGIVVTHGHEGVFIKCLLGLVNQLSMPDVSLFLVCNPLGTRVLRPLLTNPSVEFLEIPSRVDLAAKILREKQFDLLHYWECGTDAGNYILPFFRPARVQSATWGWPVSSFISCMDYYVSSEALETPESDSDYSECLMRLNSLPTYYRRPPVLNQGELKARSHFGLKPDQHVYVCAQNLRKFHPEFDVLIDGILKADPQGVFVWTGSAKAAVTNMLWQRFKRTISQDVLSRVKQVPWMAEPEYLNLLAVSDVVLDPRHYGAGANTAFDALAAGRPLVTWPTGHQRGRWAKAALERIGITETIASSACEYIRIATELGCSQDRRIELQQRVEARSSELFESMPAVRELEGFFRKALASAR